MVYAHYDGQPVVPAQWTTGPWTPVLRDGPLEKGGREVAFDKADGRTDGEWRLYGRSTSDDKAPIVGVLAALDALRAAGHPSLGEPQAVLRGRGRGRLAASARRCWRGTPTG